MTEDLALLFYLAVLALVVGCFAYLAFHRVEGRAVLGRKLSITVTCFLGDLERVFRYEELLVGWERTLMSLEFTPGEDGPQILSAPGEAILVGPYPKPPAVGRFLRAAAKAGLEPSQGTDVSQYAVTIHGTRKEIARKVVQILQEIYQFDDRKLVDVRAAFRAARRVPLAS